MQGALFLYITSVLLSKVFLQGTGAVEFFECLLIRTYVFIVSTMNLMMIVTEQPVLSGLFYFMQRTRRKDSNSLYFSPIKETSATKSHHGRILLPIIFFKWS